MKKLEFDVLPETDKNEKYPFESIIEQYGINPTNVVSLTFHKSNGKTDVLYPTQAIKLSKYQWFEVNEKQNNG